MRENLINIKPGELLRLSLNNFELELLPHEIREITNTLIKAILPKGRYAIVDFDTGRISLERGKNNSSNVGSIPIGLFKDYGAFDVLIDKLCEKLLSYKEVVYIVFKKEMLYFKDSI